MRALVCPLGSPGFLFPAIGLGLRLRDAGHDVAFLTASWASPLLREQGFTVLPGGPAFRTASWHDPRAAQAQHKLLREGLSTWPADLLLTSALALGPLMTGETLGLPTAVMGLLGRLWPGSAPDWQSRYSELLEAYGRARSGLGLGESVAEHPLLGDCLLRPWLPGQEPGPPRTVSVRPCRWEPEQSPSLRAWLRDLKEPPVFLLPGRSFGGPMFWDVAKEALADRPVAAAVARMDGPLGRVPPGWLVQPHVSVGAVLQRGGVMVASGTTTAAVASLEAGCPSLLMPTGGEQGEIARLLEDLGVAEVLAPGSLDARALRAAVERAPRRRGTAQALARQLREQALPDPVHQLEELMVRRSRV